MLEIKVYDESFVICVECLNSNTLTKIFDTLTKCMVDYVINKSAIIVKGEYHNLYRAIYLLSANYNILLD